MSYNEIQEQFIRYEERRDKLKLLFIELVLNRENLQQMSTTEANTYSVVQGEAQLVRILLTLRSQVRVINAKAQIFFSQMSQPLTGQDMLAAKHNQFIKGKAEFLLPLIAEAIAILEKRFGLTDPLPDEPDDRLTSR
jgi:uncharacterized membrane protein YhfC